ncbi:Calvin cycle protein CP12 [Leptolyngbya ohadii]|uniref:Calvin cycle protein CP12 n=1 Tax=Leptolyngbya ohadii TaxID=1962290 RepID=UPI000B59FC96|nr:Calvin cycle protein CP12 [Leptolyngbya ohadii]
MVQSISRFDQSADDAAQSASEAAISIEQRIQDALEYARTVTTAQGINSVEAVVAWDIVEELLAEKAHRKQQTKRMTAFERYCEEFPSRIECLIYDV